MVSTIKGKVIFFVTLVMLLCAAINIYFTHKDVGEAMLTAQEKSAANILHTLDLIIKDDYHNLLTDKSLMTLNSRKQLKSVATLINSVFETYSSSTKDGFPLEKAQRDSLQWLKSVSIGEVNYFIINNNAQIIASSNDIITDEIYKKLRDLKQRNISQIMAFGTLADTGDFAAFRFPSENQASQSILTYFLPFKDWKYTIATSINISKIEAEAQKKQNKIIESIREFSKNLDITRDGYVYMFNANNSILVSPGDDSTQPAIDTSDNLITGNKIHTDIRNSAESGNRELRFISSQDKGGNEFIAYCSFFKSLKWYISVIVPVKEINRPAKVLVQRQSIIISIVSVAGLLAVFLIVSRIAKPINLLSTYAKKLPTLDFTKPLDRETTIEKLTEKYHDEVGELASSFLLMREELNSNIKELISVTAARQKISSELHIAREIQQGMVPKTFPSFPDYSEFDLFATLVPAREIGGDLYDFFLIDEDHLYFALGDVSDKGIPSALLMVVTRTLIRILSARLQSPKEILSSINNLISEDNPRAMFVTLVVGVLHIPSGKITYANGGHNPPILMDMEKTAQFCTGSHDPLIGIMPDMPFSNHHLTLTPGSSFFLYTDGVNEAMNSHEEQFTADRLIDLAETNKRKSSQTVIETILDEIHIHRQDAPQSDDIAMLSIKYNGAGHSTIGLELDDHTDTDILFEQSYEPVIENVALIRENLENCLESSTLSPKKTMHLCLAADEIITNIITHGNPKPGTTIYLLLAKKSDTMILIIRDEGVSFDPTQAEDPDTTTPLAEREIGGLGLFFVHKIIDRVTYLREDEQNIITLEQEI